MELKTGQVVTLVGGEKVKIDSIDGKNPDIIFVSTLGASRHLSQISRSQIQVKKGGRSG